MRILHVGKYYHPVKGGIETALRSTAEALVAAGHEVDVLCFASGTRSRTEMIHGVRVARAGTCGTVLSQPLSPRFSRTLRELAATADVVHVHTPNPAAEFAALRLPADVPVVCTYHADVQRQRMLLPAYRPLRRAFLARCARIAVATPQHVEHSPVLQRYADKCEVVPFGLDPDRFVAGATTAARVRELRARHGDFVLFVGRLVGYKGLPVLLEAMRGLTKQLVIIGGGPLHESLAREVQSAGLAHRVHVLGELDNDAQVLAYFHACRVFCLPSTTPAEAFGMVLLEAMACGKPLVTSALRSGVAHVCQNGVNGVHAVPGDPASLREALMCVLRDPDLAAELGRNGRMRFEREFSTTVMQARLEEFYADLIPAPQRSSRSRSYARTTPPT